RPSGATAWWPARWVPSPRSRSASPPRWTTPKGFRGERDRPPRRAPGAAAAAARAGASQAAGHAHHRAAPRPPGSGLPRGDLGGRRPGRGPSHLVPPRVALERGGEGPRLLAARLLRLPARGARASLGEWLCAVGPDAADRGAVRAGRRDRHVRG